MKEQVVVLAHLTHYQLTEVGEHVGVRGVVGQVALFEGVLRQVK
jgi:hypothetical protein